MKIIEASELPEGEKVYLKKDFLGWRTVEPYKIDGKTNWMSVLFGGKRGLMFLIICLILALLLFIGIQELIGNYQTVAENPCDFCRECDIDYESIIVEYPKFNLSNIEVNGGDDG